MSSSVVRRGRGGRPAARDSAAAAGSYVVEAILADVTIGDVSMYELKWEGYSSEHNRWVAEWDLSCPELLAEYKRTKVENTADVGPFYRVLQAAKELHPITVTNTVDGVGCPEGFAYINESIYSDDVPRPCTPMFPCECEDGCVTDCPCVRDRYYDDRGRVQVGISAALMECGPTCRCSRTCSTRVVQNGSGVKFEIRRFARKGWGVVAREAIVRGTFVAEYVGELITFEEAESRGLADTAMGLTYLFDVDMACSGGDTADFSIDAKTQGNVSHFFNHSCMPNMEIRPVYIEHRDPRLHRLAFFAARDIAAGEELTFDYSPASNDGAGACDGGAMFACQCGTAACRKTIFL
ncbi:hypothetical protein LPJ61_000842 [Coemansia biformis]|uniref:Histone-lysine N-methyltransferase n=1 Tax=Coemansia biformis TaxID=1286918 RepID=A0A9W7YIU9_9FUNG|nr:hypothetical protein LPJ61_000842 [Coemansia biformis]